jgi:hypothetical protein
MARCVDLDEAPCPNLMSRPARRAGGYQIPFPVYCRLPNGRVRVPTRDELASLCVDGRYLNCAGFRRWARSYNASGGDS